MKISNEYCFQGKSTSLKAADILSTPLRIALGGKKIVIDAKGGSNEISYSTSTKIASISFLLLFFPLTLPTSLAALAYKKWAGKDPTDKKIEKQRITVLPPPPPPPPSPPQSTTTPARMPGFIETKLKSAIESVLMSKLKPNTDFGIAVEVALKKALAEIKSEEFEGLAEDYLKNREELFKTWDGEAKKIKGFRFQRDAAEKMVFLGLKACFAAIKNPTKTQKNLLDQCKPKGAKPSVQEGTAIPINPKGAKPEEPSKTEGEATREKKFQEFLAHIPKERLQKIITAIQPQALLLEYLEEKIDALPIDEFLEMTKSFFENENALLTPLQTFAQNQRVKFDRTSALKELFTKRLKNLIEGFPRLSRVDQEKVLETLKLGSDLSFIPPLKNLSETIQEKLKNTEGGESSIRWWVVFQENKKFFTATEGEAIEKSLNDFFAYLENLPPQAAQEFPAGSGERIYLELLSLLDSWEKAPLPSLEGLNKRIQEIQLKYSGLEKLKLPSSKKLKESKVFQDLKQRFSSASDALLAQSLQLEEEQKNQF